MNDTMSRQTYLLIAAWEQRQDEQERLAIAREDAAIEAEDARRKEQD